LANLATAGGGFPGDRVVSGANRTYRGFGGSDAYRRVECGGNAGTQTLALVVRALVVKELTAQNALYIIGKEVLVDGMIFAVLTAGIAYFWFSDLLTRLVIGLAMINDLFIAGLAGILAPLGLNWANIDPVVASSVILTTITDVVEFFCFLELVALVLF
jgi:magnesium transporter